MAFNGTKGRLAFNVLEVAKLSCNEDFNKDFGMLSTGANRVAHVPEIIFQPYLVKP